MSVRFALKSVARQAAYTSAFEFLERLSCREFKGEVTPPAAEPETSYLLWQAASPLLVLPVPGKPGSGCLIKVGEPSPRDRYLGSRSSQRVLGPKGERRIPRSLLLGLTRSTGYQPKQPRSEGTPSCGCVVTRDAVRHGVAGLRPGAPVARRLR